jgi:serine/threonine-protein kinase SRPK3
VVIQKIGWGHFSTVWLAKDFKYKNYVALKIQKSAPHYLEAAYDEVEIL